MKIAISAAVELLRTENDRLAGEAKHAQDQIARMQFALADPRCSGMAYSVIREKLLRLRIPAAQIHAITFEATIVANKQNIVMLNALPQSSTGVLDTEELDSMIEKLQQQNRSLAYFQSSLRTENIFDNWMYSRNNLMIDANNALVVNLKEKKSTAFVYDAHSTSLYGALKQTVSAMLQKSSEAISAWLETGTYGSTAWVADTQQRFKAMQISRFDRFVQEVSAEKNDVPFFSFDHQSIFINGERIPVFNPLTEPYFDEPVFLSVYQDIDYLALDGDILYNVGKLLTGINFSDPNMNSVNSSGYATGRRHSQPVSNLTASSGLANALDALNRVSVRLIIQSNGTDKRIVMQAGSISDWRTIRENCGIDQKNPFVGPNPHYMIIDQSIARQIYVDKTEMQPVDKHTYTVSYSPDIDRVLNNDHSHYGYIIFYDQNGNLMRSARSYPNDSFSILDSYMGENLTYEYLGQPYSTAPTKAPEDYQDVLSQLAR